MTTQRSQQPEEKRYARGLRILHRIGGEDYDGPIKRLAQTSPDLSRFTVEYPYGDILSRPGLDLPLRQLCTVAMLITDGSAQPQLKFHITGFINAGGEPRVLVELLFLAVAILGFPAAINSVGLVRKVFQEQEIAFEPLPPATDDGSERERQGKTALTQLIAGDLGQLSQKLRRDLARTGAALGCVCLRRSAVAR
ncbi:carboxymuconolactone decarboxylase family protein [Mesorhizobium escarrei]|uniref:4-carboxymuconolactone decarboxylase n=1 Tax=Mesorhizobium escarrei TaxID=666018 RepID=A0ABN8JTR8_9HYPH|nr:carboxymuconolactone decarboxylase family protein [Mesorhizobium escarrei]CAH2400321.1 putative 4-carboxymuconolactone decarboxylase [Mesorhizobium escarrei]